MFQVQVVVVNGTNTEQLSSTTVLPEMSQTRYYRVLQLKN